MSEKNTKQIETVEVDPGMSVMPEGPGLMDVPTVIPELDSMLAAMSSALPAYQTTAWKDKPNFTTPVTAAVMTRIEQRLVDLTNAVNGLRDSVSQYRTKWGKTLSFPMSEAQMGIVLIGTTIVSGILCSNNKVYINREASEKLSLSYSDGTVTMTSREDVSLLVVVFNA